jgi:ADP-ribose pyrophosphatase YjhB (NUDIX family)
MNGVTNFNLRVYGLLIESGFLLVTDENRGDVQMTKFPGGGLEKGEGLVDGLKREFMEELEIDINVKQFYYVNDFLQISAFNPKDQLLSFYYLVDTDQMDAISVSSEKKPVSPGEQVFRWIKLSEINPEEFNFPIDRMVAQELMKMVEG